MKVLNNIVDSYNKIPEQVRQVANDAGENKVAKMGAIAIKAVGALFLAGAVCTAIHAVPLLVAGSAVGVIMSLVESALCLAIAHDLGKMGDNMYGWNSSSSKLERGARGLVAQVGNALSSKPKDSQDVADEQFCNSLLKDTILMNAWFKLSMKAAQEGAR